MQCSDALGGRCVFTDDSPWVIYQADDDTPSVAEVYAIRKNLLGEMNPIKLNRQLEPGWGASWGGVWSPDGKVYAFNVENVALRQPALQLVHFGSGLPDEAQQIEGANIEWAPSGLAFAVTQRTGLFVYEYSGDGRFEQVFSAVDAGTDNTYGSWSPLDEYVYALTKTSNDKSSIRRVARNGASWVGSSLIEDVADMQYFRISPKGSELVYELAGDGWTRPPLHVMRVDQPSVPKQLAPEGDHAYSWSPDGERFLVTKEVSDGVKAIFLGTGSIYATTGVRLAASLPVDRAHFTPDSKQVVLVQRLGAWGVDYDLLDPMVTTDHVHDSLGRSGYGDGGPHFAPDHDTIAMPSREIQGANIELTLSSLSGRRSTATLDSIPPETTYRYITFSRQGQFLAYAKGAHPNYDGAYVDLRYNTVADPKPVRLPGDGILYQVSFGGSDSDLYYVREQPNGARECFHLDLAGQVAKEAVKLSRAGRVDYCTAQPKP